MTDLDSILKSRDVTLPTKVCLENPMGRGAWLATVHGVTRVGHDLVTKPRVFG